MRAYVQTNRERRIKLAWMGAWNIQASVGAAVARFQQSLHADRMRRTLRKWAWKARERASQQRALCIIQHRAGHVAVVCAVQCILCLCGTKAGLFSWSAIKWLRSKVVMRAFIRRRTYAANVRCKPYAHGYAVMELRSRPSGYYAHPGQMPTQQSLQGMLQRVGAYLLCTARWRVLGLYEQAHQSAMPTGLRSLHGLEERRVRHILSATRSAASVQCPVSVSIPVKIAGDVMMAFQRWSLMSTAACDTRVRLANASARSSARLAARAMRVWHQMVSR
jgi:hypothetical protein